MSAAPSFDDRTLDLLAQDATEGLEATQLAELEAISPEGDLEELRRRARLELAAASLHLALLPADAASRLPAPLEQRLHEAGRRFAKERSGIIARIGPSPASTLPAVSRPSVLGWVPWAVAACFAVVAAWSYLRPSLGPAPSPSPVPFASATQTPASVRQAADLIEVAWTPWDNPQVAGVQGDVRWSESLQRGIMRFRWLPANDPASTQYQLWIIDERGMGQRISGAVFNASNSGEIEVPVEPLIPVRNAAAFAVTVERPGGTWVSDMSRRVVIASRR